MDTKGFTGLIGLVISTVEQRTKEIGMRKVLGASTSSVIKTLTLSFLQMVLFSNIIALPMAWFMVRRWLSGFAYQTTLNPIDFILAGAFAILIALLTVCGRAYNTAVARPMEALRYE